MTLLGLDFDNTLVRYDKLFHKLALEKDLIKESMPVNKIAIRDFLRSQGLDEEFSLLQGEVYGLRILEAEPAEGMLEALSELHQGGMPMVLVSHKTRTPYKGPAYDLHRAAWSWLEINGFFSQDGLNWQKDQVFFEASKESKVNTIKALKCSAYIDDLPEVLDLIPNSIEKYLYDPLDTCNFEKSPYKVLNDWGKFVKMLKK